MKYAICRVPVAPIRISALHETEMSSELLFGECAEILETINSEWYHISCQHDGYTGFCQASQLLEVGESIFNASSKKLIREWTGSLEWNGIPIHVPMGSMMTGMENGVARWNENVIKYSGSLWDPANIVRHPELIKKLAMEYFNTAYLWGARTVYGADCSGFTQMICRFLGINLPRDAWQQERIGEKLNSVADAKCGDLAFFSDVKGKIIHVGIILDPGKIIHASGRVRIDKLTEAGIINHETGLQNYTLASVRSLF
ncbi:MAG: hypothetical protein C5B52_07410 [Bacteroidetes bacterium]|nr:MAG: hypothetical protein C5B52_07410 [Bacteroidota bacterium]